MDGTTPTDPRLLRSNGRVAHVSLEGQLSAERFVEGTRKRVAWAHAATPLSISPNGGRAKDLLSGGPFHVLEEEGPLAFGFDPTDGYVGYVHAAVLEEASTATHRVTALGSHIYAAPDMKSTALGHLSIGSLLSVVEEKDGFVSIGSSGLWVPTQHIAPIGSFEDDPAAVAERLLGVPYLWGGNSSTGIDCSGLTQMSLHLCGRACPRDSDQQAAAFDDATGPLRRGDLVCWKGHVGMLLDEKTLIHANAHHMAVATEPLDEAIARIAKREFGEVTKIVRP